MIKKALLMITTMAVCVTLLTPLVWANNKKFIEAALAPFQWNINGKTYSSSDLFDNGKTRVPSSLNYQGTTYIPIRQLADAFHYEIEWDSKTNTASFVDSIDQDDPVADFPGKYPNVPFHTDYVLTKDTPLLDKPIRQAKTLKALKKGDRIMVLQEMGRDWLEVIADNKIGYIPPTTSDYVLLADRPEWERKSDLIINIGLKYLGTPYKFDARLGQTANFDCSSFVNYIYGLADIKLPRNSRQQSKMGEEVQRDQIRKGDLLFFTTPKRKDLEGVNRIGHVAVYLGDNKVLHTYRVGIGVTVTELDSNWNKRFIKAMRVI